MASVTKLKDKWRCQIRLKSFQMEATFDDEKTAKLWGFYKEKAIKEIEKFNVPLGEMFTLGDMIEGKVNSLRMSESHHKTSADVIFLKKEFEEFLDTPISEITYEVLKEKVQKMRNSVVRRGGNTKDNSGGILNQQSFATIIRKMRCLGSVFSFAQDLNVKLENSPNRIASELLKMKSAKSEN